MLHEGWKLAYETPVLGYPWSIPYEFPIYQAIAACISWISHFPLDNTGRLLSFCFLIACAWPALMTTRRLNLPDRAAWIFCALFWSSPLYLFYSRTFLIETAALFFTLAAVPYALDLRDSKASKSVIALFIFFAALALLQKVTMAAPVMMVIGFVVLAAHVRERRLSLRALIRLSVAFGLPLLAEAWWSNYSNIVRSHNAYGSEFTNASLKGWIFGTIEQRTNFRVLAAIFWHRLICRDALGPLGLLLLAGALVGAEKRIRIILLVNLTLFVLPVFIFTNLQYIHDYYQAECAVFLISAVSIAIAAWLPKLGWPSVIPSITILFVILNLFTFYRTYANYLTKSFNTTNSAVLAISDVVRRYTPPDSAIVIYGLDWSSTIPYYAERKAFAAARDMDIFLQDEPKQYKNYPSAWKRPERYLGGMKLGAIVFCPSDELMLDQILAHPDVRGPRNIFKVQSCYIYLPGAKSIVTSYDGNIVLPGIPLDPLFDMPPTRYSKTIHADCTDSIDEVNNKFFGMSREHLPHGKIDVPGLLLLEGRLAGVEAEGAVPEDAFLTFRSSTGVVKYVALKPTPRGAAYSFMLEACPTCSNLFAATPDIHSLKGNYSLGLARGYGDTLRLCDGNDISLNIGSSAAR